jgi:hypothetical protein
MALKQSGHALKRCKRSRASLHTLVKLQQCPPQSCQEASRYTHDVHSLTMPDHLHNMMLMYFDKGCLPIKKVKHLRCLFSSWRPLPWV